MRRLNPPRLPEGPAFAAEGGASADSSEKMKDTPGVIAGRQHFKNMSLIALSFQGKSRAN
jgi:hypothetical protein